MHSAIYRKIQAPVVGCLLLAGTLAFAPRPVSAAMESYMVFIGTTQGQI
jgi:hypothetical protein